MAFYAIFITISLAYEILQARPQRRMACNGLSSRERDVKPKGHLTPNDTLGEEDTVLTTLARKFAQNTTRIPLAWGFKLANSVTSCDKIESGSLYPSEIWQP